MSGDERALHDAVAKKLADEGKLIEAGFVGMRLMIIPAGASEGQVSDMRIAFMSGAHHLFASIMSIMDPESEPTENDMRRMALIDAELQAFVENELKLRAAKGTRQ
jgi:hypothetical protein